LFNQKDIAWNQKSDLFFSGRRVIAVKNLAHQASHRFLSGFTIDPALS